MPQKQMSKKKLKQANEEYLYNDPLTRCVSNVNPHNVPGSSISSISYNLVKSQVEAKKNQTSILNREDKHQKSELKAMMDLDTRRYQIQKKDAESLDTQFKERFAKFSNIENAMRNHSQYPATGFHAVVTKKFDQSLSKNSGIK